MKITPDAAASYGGAAASIAAGLTLQDFAVWVGILTALVSCMSHLYFSWKRSQIEERVANARIAEAQSHTAQSTDGDGGSNG